MNCLRTLVILENSISGPPTFLTSEINIDCIHVTKVCQKFECTTLSITSGDGNLNSDNRKMMLGVSTRLSKQNPDPSNFNYTVFWSI